MASTRVMISSSGRREKRKWERRALATGEQVVVLEGVIKN